MQMIRKVELFFQGQYKHILEELEDEMENAASNLEFEKAAELRDEIAELREILLEK